MNLNNENFSDIDPADPFFDSLKLDYGDGFSKWFERKSLSREVALIFRDVNQELVGFLYTKIEHESLEDIEPTLPAKPRLKIGTLKILPHGTRLGERFIKKAIDRAYNEGVEEIYVTVFPKHEALVTLFKKYGFQQCGMKGEELVLLKKLRVLSDGILTNYPLIDTTNKNVFMLGIQPKFHTRLFPDSRLINESPDLITDVSHTNSIHKIYLAAMKGMEEISTGDIIVIYRTNDGQGAAHFRSVATSICVVEEYRDINTFGSLNEFLTYCSAYSVFTRQELERFWRQKKYPHILKFTYNMSLTRRPNRSQLLDNGIMQEGYAGFQKWDTDSLLNIVRLSGSDESFILHTP